MRTTLDDPSPLQTRIWSARRIVLMVRDRNRRRPCSTAQGGLDSRSLTVSSAEVPRRGWGPVDPSGHARDRDALLLTPGVSALPTTVS
jgi:hypothetical protein